MQASLAIPRLDYRGGPEADESLVAQVRIDSTNFTPLYHRYRDRIYWYLRARVASDEDAADLTQQVFLQALERLQQYQEHRGSFAGWLFAIARHAAADSHRRPRLVDWEYLAPALQGTDADTTEAQVMRQESVTRITRLVGALSSRKRELIVLRFVSALTIPDIAAVIGKSPEATRKELRRTLKTLKEKYHDPNS